MSINPIKFYIIISMISTGQVNSKALSFYHVILWMSLLLLLSYFAISNMNYHD